MRRNFGEEGAEKMSEFKVIETQDQFDKMIEDRLKNERESVEKKYEGYLSPEAVEKKYGAYLSPEDAEEKYKGYLSPEDAAKLNAELKKHQTSSVKMKIASELGIPMELAERLSGDDEKSIRKDAEAFSAIMGSPKRGAPPLRSMEPNLNDKTESAYRSMLSDMKGE